MEGTSVSYYRRAGHRRSLTVQQVSKSTRRSVISSLAGALAAIRLQPLFRGSLQEVGNPFKSLAPLSSFLSHFEGGGNSDGRKQSSPRIKASARESLAMAESDVVLMGEKPPSSVVVVCHGPAHPHQSWG
jgi:hypothetical protein